MQSKQYNNHLLSNINVNNHHDSFKDLNEIQNNKTNLFNTDVNFINKKSKKKKRTKSNERDESTHRLHKNDNKNTLNEMKDTTEQVLGHILELTPMSSQQYREKSSCESDLSVSFDSRRNSEHDSEHAATNQANH